jgi:hypothetical protein
MIVSHPALAVTTHARSAAYDLVLLAHVLAALVALGTVVVSGCYAVALLRSGARSEAVRRYYRPGVNWGGRVLFLVPVFGVALVAMSRGDWSFSDGWVTIGLAAWAVAAVVAEAVLWPAERRLQDAVGGATAPADRRPDCLLVAVVAAGLAVVLVGAGVVMVAKP